MANTNCVGPEITFRNMQKSTSMSRLSDNEDFRKSKSFHLKSRRESIDALNKTWEGNMNKFKKQKSGDVHKPYSINATIIKIEESTAVLLTDEYEMFEVPVCLLPSHITISNIITLELEKDEDAQRKRDKNLIELEEKIQSIYNTSSYCLFIMRIEFNLYVP